VIAGVSRSQAQVPAEPGARIAVIDAAAEFDDWCGNGLRWPPRPRHLVDEFGAGRVDVLCKWGTCQGSCTARMRMVSTSRWLITLADVGSGPTAAHAPGAGRSFRAVQDRLGLSLPAQPPAALARLCHMSAWDGGPGGRVPRRVLLRVRRTPTARGRCRSGGSPAAVNTRPGATFEQPKNPKQARHSRSAQTDVKAPG
jgi:hypothetical protein